MRYLVKCNIVYHSSNNWHIKPSAECKVRGEKEFTLKMTPPMFQKLLSKLKAKDDIVSPRSLKGRTYKQITDEIISNSDNTVYFWSETYPKSFEQLNKIFLTIKNEMREEKINFLKYAKRYRTSVDKVKDAYQKAVDLAKEIYGNNSSKYNDWVLETLSQLLTEEKKIMKNLFIKFVESGKAVDEFIEEVVSGDITGDLDDTTGKQDPEVVSEKKKKKKDEAVEDKEINADMEADIEGTPEEKEEFETSEDPLPGTKKEAVDKKKNEEEEDSESEEELSVKEGTVKKFKKKKIIRKLTPDEQTIVLDYAYKSGGGLTEWEFESDLKKMGVSGKEYELAWAGLEFIDNKHLQPIPNLDRKIKNAVWEEFEGDLIVSL
jgi:hypothetical protein